MHISYELCYFIFKCKSHAPLLHAEHRIHTNIRTPALLCAEYFRTAAALLFFLSFWLISLSFGCVRASDSVHQVRMIVALPKFEAPSASEWERDRRNGYVPRSLGPSRTGIRNQCSENCFVAQTPQSIIDNASGRVGRCCRIFGLSNFKLIRNICGERVFACVRQV